MISLPLFSFSQMKHNYVSPPLDDQPQHRNNTMQYCQNNNITGPPPPPLSLSCIASHRIASHRRADLQTALAQYIADHYPSSEAVGSVFCSARPVVRKEVPQAEVQNQAQAVGGAETVGQQQGQGDEKEVEVQNEDGKSRVGEVAATQVDQKSNPAAETAVPIVQGDHATTNPAQDKDIDVDTQATTLNPDPASAEATSASSSVDPAADPSSATGTGTETSETGILAAANSAVAAVSETVETVKEALSAEVPVGGVAGLESEKPAVVGEDSKTENENDAAKPDQGDEFKVSEEPVQDVQEEEEPSYTICIVSNKYNTNNFW